MSTNWVPGGLTLSKGFAHPFRGKPNLEGRGSEKRLLSVFIV